ncbi:MAG: DUF4199 domain-containing protein [Bacteroidales bacterium]|nr:DUF4199 domain-containing protein [Bacteroidales bacterium]MCM1146721.1 DUF4199 domain-containing protein [Bacteroidales bacterium]MCM1205538.1 DUF4199 domain-containing protein [Bacillota bacterium]MCM1509200.1 DUF4199 domain-containing protein [Clostridium sp.]
MTRQEYIQLKAYARQQGTAMGLLWIASFACFVGSISEPYLSFFFNFTIILIPFLAASFVRYYRDRILGGILSFRRAYCYSLLLFFYATLLLAIVQWGYFEFLDNGRMLGSMVTTVNSPEFVPALEAYNVSKEEVLEQLNILSETRPIDFAFTFMWMNIFFGAVLSWFIALFTKRSTPRGNRRQQ